MTNFVLSHNIFIFAQFVKFLERKISTHCQLFSILNFYQSSLTLMLLDV